MFAVTFAFGSGLAGLGGALGAEILGLDPIFPLKFMIYFLIVVTVGGTSSITGPFLASLLLGIADVAGKYYVPKLGAFVDLHDHDRGADLAPAGPVRAPGGAMSGECRTGALAFDDVARRLAAARAGAAGDRVLAVAALRRSVCCPGKHLILTEIAILALFALSLDLILGYAGIISLGHAAFFGFGAYAAGLLAKHAIVTEPVLGARRRGPRRGGARLRRPAFSCCAAPT